MWLSWLACWANFELSIWSADISATVSRGGVIPARQPVLVGEAARKAAAGLARRSVLAAEAGAPAAGERAVQRVPFVRLVYPGAGVPAERTACRRNSSIRLQTALLRLGLHGRLARRLADGIIGGGAAGAREAELCCESIDDRH